MLARLTTLEKKVIEAARQGDVACPVSQVKVKDLAVTDDPRLRVRAGLFRELLRGLHGDLDPRGIQVMGVRVVGALDLDDVAAVSGLSLRRCAFPDGISCKRAHLRDLYLNGSLLTHLHADDLHADGNVFLRDATITGNSEDGAIRLYSAHIAGHLDLGRATITNATGPALHAEGIQTDGNLHMEGANVTGASGRGAIRLHNAHIGGQAALGVTKVNNSSGPLLVLLEAHITGAFFPPSVVCPKGSTDRGRRDCPDKERALTAHGLTYPILRDMEWRQWLHLLVHHTADYWPQPFQQLATTERAAGHDNNAREILIAQQRDLYHRAHKSLGGWSARRRHQLWGLLGSYGYRAHRLVVVLGVVLALAGGVGYWAGHTTTRPGHHAAERVQSLTAPVGTSCSFIELVGLGIDRGLPLGVTGVRTRCDLDTGPRKGQAFTIGLWVLQALLWGLATLAIAAYTGLVRKPS
jgi:hypothetical protein